MDNITHRLGDLDVKDFVLFMLSNYPDYIHDKYVFGDFDWFVEDYKKGLGEPKLYPKYMMQYTSSWWEPLK